MTIEEYLEEAIASFERDPADTQFQKGYQAALEETQKFLLQQKNSDWGHFFLDNSFEMIYKSKCSANWRKVEKLAVKMHYW